MRHRRKKQLTLLLAFLFTSAVVLSSIDAQEKLRCTISEIDCGHSVCVSGNGRCDGVSDCIDGRDETNCARCEGRCFLDGPRGGCWCDDACVSYKDCCSDFLAKCMSFLNFTSAPPAVDECNPVVPSHNCDVNAICSDTPSSFICTCTSGFVGDGITCADVQSPNITCPADLTVYTNCRKNYSRVLLPEADSVFDNSGVYYITIDVDGSAYDAFDSVNLDLSSSPHLVRYNATDEAYNFAQCEMHITVAALQDASFCTSTANPPNCICLPAMGQGCTCSSAYCGHDCSQSSEGVQCTGPAMPFPNCTDVDVCDPGHSGPRCTSSDDKVQCPKIENKCLEEGVSDVFVSWILSEEINPADIDCSDFSGNKSNVKATGGVFGTGHHDVVCVSKSVAFPECLISFIVSAYPILTVPTVGDQCTDPGMDTSTVTWTEIYAMDAGEVSIDCTDSGDGVGVGITGGVFGLGNHVITCIVTNSAGCVTHNEFTFTVNKGNLLPFGTASGDALLSDVPQELFLSSKDLISPTIYPPDFFPICDGMYEKLYFTDNGVIVFSNEQSLDKLAFPSAPSNGFTGNKAMITPFWADVKGDAFSPTSNVFWQVYNQYVENVNQDMLDIIGATASTKSSNFSANWALVVTWSNVRAISFSRETNTFQAVLATDGIHGFVIFNYDPCGLNWDFSFLSNKNVIQGFTCGTSKDPPVYVVNPNEWEYLSGTIKGNTGQAGRWVFPLNTPRPDFVNPRQQCHNWHGRQPPYHSLGIYFDAFADTCPCSLVNARLDWRYIQVPAYDLPQGLRSSNVPAVCYVRLFQFPGTPGLQCCYNTFTGDLLYNVRTPRVSSVFERFPFSPIFYTNDLYQQWLDEEVWPRFYCCERSTLCDLYIQWRPLMTCWSYVPPAWLWFWGDPHIVTLDGLEYTFNGLGEYTLALIEDDDGQRVFELQGRTRQVVDTETGELSQATIYSGFAAVYTGEARIEIKLSDDAMDLVTTVNGTVVTPSATGLHLGNLLVTRAENPIKVSIMYSDYVSFSVGVNNSMADITVLINQDFKGKTKGILGVWNDDPSNDVLTRNGTLQTGSGDDGELLERDFFEFGETWRIAEEDSLFFYQSPDESYNSLNDPAFAPDFLQDLIDKAPPGKYNDAKAVCGSSKVCLYDSLALNDTSIGMATLELDEMNTINMAMSMNFPPNLTLVETVEVIVGQDFTLQLQAADPNGDNITYHMLQTVKGASISSDGLFKWTPANRSKVSIGFLATDGIANATLEPTVKLCDCENDGTCLFNQYVSGTNLIQDRFGVVLCDCQPGWTGDFCEMDYDACADSPCFIGVACTDEAPPSFNSTCGPCPEGLEGDGKSCQDIDECQLYRDQPASSGGLGCDQNCENVLMNYTCSCNPGYLLHEDGRQCIDCQVLSCLNGGTFDVEFCECACPLTHSGSTCSDENPCLSGNRCPDAQHYCLPNSNQDGFTCICNVFDGFFLQDDSSCRKLPSKQIVVTADLDFNQAYKNPTSTAFRRQAAVFERAIFMRLKENPPTNGVSSVHVPWMEEGSVVVRSMASFEKGAPSDASLQQVFSSSPSLSDGVNVIKFDRDSVTVNDGEIDCVPTYCKNGGTCEASGNFPYVSYTCSCQTSYTGERCETDVQVSHLEPDSGGLSTVTVVLIIVGCIVLLIVVVCMLVCMCLLIQRQHAKSLAYREDKQRSGVPRDGDRSMESVDVSCGDEAARMSRLMHVMSRSGYMQEVNPAGRVVRNPMVN